MRSLSRRRLAKIFRLWSPLPIRAQSGSSRMSERPRMQQTGQGDITAYQRSPDKGWSRLADGGDAPYPIGKVAQSPFMQTFSGIGAMSPGQGLAEADVLDGSFKEFLRRGRAVMTMPSCCVAAAQFPAPKKSGCRVRVFQQRKAWPSVDLLLQAMAVRRCR